MKLRSLARLLLPAIVLSGCAGPSDRPPPPSLDETPAKEAAAETEGTAKTPLAGGAVEGVDVSHFQGEVDWSAVKSAGIAFAIVKATEGIDLLDPHYRTNWRALRKAGLVRGAYHFFRPGDDGETQAQFFLDHVQLKVGDLPPILDFESRGDLDAEDVLAEVKDWLQTVEIATSMTPILYTDPDFWDTLETDEFGDYPLWIADYGVDEPAVPASWTEWTLWQHSDTGSIDGIDGDVDLSRLNDSVRLDRLVIR